MKLLNEAASMVAKYAEILVGGGTSLLIFAILLLIIGVLLDLLVWRSIRDRRVMERPPVAASTILLALLSALCFIGGLLILLA